MNLLFNSTETFEQELAKLDTGLRQKTTQRINEIGRLFIQDKRRFAQQARKPTPVPLNNGFDSSLYSVTVEPDLRIILTADDDPLFDQSIITLLRIVKRAELSTAFTTVAQSLYQYTNGNISTQGAEVG